ncbi:hypothetical protein MHJ94_04100 [Chryseobacterium taklimakanense]|nr:hypothetical protein [Chryseobacterium taklimakanense]MCG7280474.1 hypothetical protein [Chryseobacterium taklimakanense]
MPLLLQINKNKPVDTKIENTHSEDTSAHRICSRSFFRLSKSERASFFHKNPACTFINPDLSTRNKTTQPLKNAATQSLIPDGFDFQFLRRLFFAFQLGFSAGIGKFSFGPFFLYFLFHKIDGQKTSSDFGSGAFGLRYSTDFLSFSSFKRNENPGNYLWCSDCGNIIFCCAHH